MIGLVVNPKDLEVAEEFFQLFKTPWERAVAGRKYHIVLSTEGISENLDAEVFLIYGSGEQAIDRDAGFPVNHVKGLVGIEWREWTVPIYGEVGIFEGENPEGVLKAQGKPVDCRYGVGERIVRRIGYNLFEEIRYLLTEGQPAAQALTPTLDLHIDLLRHLLIESKIAFLEIPPFPKGHKFICCLTHDVDFFGIRRHKFDRTLVGFLYRASIGSLIDLMRGRRSLTEAARNWLAFCSLPLVLAKLLPDFWRPFNDYAKVEDGRRSTFFLVPFRGRPGLAPDGPLNRWRAVPYGIGEIQEEVKHSVSCGSELGVHGIDAWRDADAGRQELSQLKAITGQKAVGIRMHWLYCDAGSPRRLEEAGFDYDSTWGYNEAVGYRAGTSQVFRPLGTKELLELPMAIMDSALFSSGRMGLSPREAMQPCRRILENARYFGGTLVINWHERSLAPERLWGRFYKELLEEVGRGNQAWVVTAGEAVAWFRWRRSVRFHENASSGVAHVQVSAPSSAISRAVVRMHRDCVSRVEVKDIDFDGVTPIEVEVQTKQN